MTAGSGSGEGRLEKTELQENKRKRVAKQVGGAMGTRINPLTGQEETDWSQYNLSNIPAALYGAYATDMQKLGAGTGMGAAQTNPNVAGQNQGMSNIQQLVAQNQALAAQQEAAQRVAAQQQAALAAQRQIAQQQLSQNAGGMSNPVYRQSIIDQQRIQRDIDANQRAAQYNPNFSKYIEQAVPQVGGAGYSETNPFGLTPEQRAQMNEDRKKMSVTERQMQYALMNQQKQAQQEMLRRMSQGMSEAEAGEFVRQRFAPDFAHIKETFSSQQAQQPGQGVKITKT